METGTRRVHADLTVAAKSRRRKYWILTLLVLLGIALVWFLPTIIARTSLRDWVLNSIASAPQYEISSRAASFDWFSPLVIDDLEIDKSDGTAKLKIQRLVAEKSWLELWLSSPNLGSFSIDRPQVRIIAKEDQPANDADSSSIELMPTLSASIKDAHVVVRTMKDAEPEIDVDHIDLEIQLERADSIRFMGVGPILLMDRTELTPELFKAGLQLVAPEIADELNIRGTMSVELIKARLPLYTDQDQFPKLMEIEGILRLHQITAGIKNATTQRLAKMFAELLDLGEVPDEWQIVNDSAIQFHVRQGRVEHKGLAMILSDVAPDFEISTSGSVSMDEQVELVVMVNLPHILLGKSSLAGKVAETPIEFRITGTIDQPKFQLPVDPQWVVKLSDHLVSETLSAEEKELADDVIQLVADLYAESEGVSIPQQLLVRIRSLAPVNQQ